MLLYEYFLNINYTKALNNMQLNSIEIKKMIMYSIMININHRISITICKLSCFLMAAKAMLRMFLLTEIVFSLLFNSLGYWFVSYNGIIRLTQAYSTNYLFYLVFMLIVFS